MQLSQRQLDTLEKVKTIASVSEVDPVWAAAVALTESSLGLRQKSPTGAKGVFNMTSIMMKDLLLSMGKMDDDIVDVLCGVAALHLLFKRFGNIEEATAHFCNPADRPFYIKRVSTYMEELSDDKVL